MDLKLNHPKNKIWISSDFHLNHNKSFIYEPRGFKSSEEHTVGLLSTINQYVQKDDVLISLGDFCLNTSYESCLELIEKINCNNIYHIWGNHNNPLMKLYREQVNLQFHLMDNLSVYPLTYKNFTFLGDYIELKVAKDTYILFHYPIASWNYMRAGVSMLCGHSHYSYPTSRADVNNGKILDLGWEGWKRPMNLEEIDLVLANKQIIKVDHHSH